MVDFVPECIGFLLNLHPFFQICIGSAHKMCALNLMHRTCAVIQAARLIIIVQCNPAALYHRVRVRDRRNQASGVRMYRMGENLLRRARLQKVAQMKNADAVGNIFNHREVVGDEEVCKPCLVLMSFIRLTTCA